MGEKIYQKTWFCVLMMFCCCFPLGIFLMWKYKKFNKPVRIIISAFFALLVVSAITSEKKSINNVADNKETQPTEETKLTTAYAEISEEYTKETEVQLTEDSETQIVETIESIEQNTETNNDRLKNDLNSILSSDIADKAYDILINQIGFTGVHYIGKNPVGDTNFDFSADSYDFTLTASDDVYRVFQPNGGAVFYEDGKVKNTISDIKSKTIDSYDRTAYYIMAQGVVEQGLKNPKSAKFPSIVTRPEEISVARNGDIVAVQSYVDAQNSYGGKVRSKWVAQFIVTDIDTYSCEPLYLNVDGNIVYGEWTEME